MEFKARVEFKATEEDIHVLNELRELLGTSDNSNTIRVALRRMLALVRQSGMRKSGHHEK